MACLLARHRTPREGFAVFRLVDRGKMGKWRRGGGEGTERKKVQEERARERPMIGHNVLETKKLWLSNSPLQMRELEAKSIDSPASDGWSMDDSVTTRNATWDGGWEWKGSRGDIAGRGTEKGREGITNRDRRSMIQITARLPE